MATLPILQYPDPRLTKICAPVTEFNDNLKQLAADMAETMYAAPGIGLAAPQIGMNIQLVVIDVSEEKNQLMVLVNPKITTLGEETVTGEEGCLSLPDLYEKVVRANRIRVDAQNLLGEAFSLECEGLLAVCVQHEVDHLRGHVFIDHLSQLKKSRAITKLLKLRREKARAKKTSEN